MAAPGEQGRGDGPGEPPLVDGVRDLGGTGDEWGDLDGDGRAGERVDGLDGGVRQVDGEVGAGDGGADLAGEAEALGDTVGLRRLPREDARSGRGGRGVGVGVDVGGGFGRRERRGDDVDAVAGGGGVEEDAGDRVGVVGDAGALVRRGCRRWGLRVLRVGGGGRRGVCLTGEEDGEVVAGEEGADTVGERQGDVLLEKAVVELGSVVGAAVCGVEEDEVVVDVGGGGARRGAGGCC